MKDDAILVESSTDAAPFFTSNLQDPMKAVLIRWRPEMLYTPVFRQAVRIGGDFTTSAKKPLSYSTYNYYLN
jgi:hypothetical protein